MLPIGQEKCRNSAYSDEPDFEDSLIRAAAEQNDMDFIITRDSGAFTHSPCKITDRGTIPAAVPLDPALVHRISLRKTSHHANRIPIRPRNDSAFAASSR